MRNDYDSWMKWNDRLRQAFEAAKSARKITKTDLANACGVAPASVTDWLNGETQNIEARFLMPACKFLRVSPFWIMLGDESEHDFVPPPLDEEVMAIDVVKLVMDYAQTNDEGRARILATTTKTRRSFPRS